MSILITSQKEQIAQAILHRRKVLGIKQDDLAELADISVRYLYAIEKGKANPSIETLINILDVLGLTVNINIKELTI